MLREKRTGQRRNAKTAKVFQSIAVTEKWNKAGLLSGLFVLVGTHQWITVPRTLPETLWIYSKPHHIIQFLFGRSVEQVWQNWGKLIHSLFMRSMRSNHLSFDAKFHAHPSPNMLIWTLDKHRHPQFWNTEPKTCQKKNSFSSHQVSVSF